MLATLMHTHGSCNSMLFRRALLTRFFKGFLEAITNDGSFWAPLLISLGVALPHLPVGKEFLRFGLV